MDFLNITKVKFHKHNTTLNVMGLFFNFISLNILRHKTINKGIRQTNVTTLVGYT